MTLILGIETSCDETAAAVVEEGRIILSNVVASQVELHRQYGGVFPEMASRQHMVAITPVIREALATAQVTWDDLNAIAVVHGPGLAGSLLVGLNVAKALSLATDLPLIAVNHLEAHVYANWLLPPDVDPQTFVPPSFPLICLVVSGGHTELIEMREHHEYHLLGHTIDDAAGEAFDKVARLLNLGFPGGPAIQRAAEEGNALAFAFPRALNVGRYDFSFSGLKTAVLRLVQELQQAQGAKIDVRGQKLAEASIDETQTEIPVADIAASFQAAVVDALVEKTAQAVADTQASQVLIAGGVAANRLLRSEMVRRLEVPVRYPPIRFCTDNAAMVAVAGYYNYLAGDRAGLELDVIPGLSLV
ncbi:MAG: tRNA (adenosine(37)-N6)-threonylcarbamoyltransferase complex transferase subunit TsaD [Chloroflexi bacterium]|nr:tRNA (adenosine(37)-N6)-threonylcarbamoyltransferase complex transferase subunit TsaD [Chloroflexota bacterium]